MSLLTTVSLATEPIQGSHFLTVTDGGFRLEALKLQEPLPEVSVTWVAMRPICMRFLFCGCQRGIMQQPRHSVCLSSCRVSILLRGGLKGFRAPPLPTSPRAGGTMKQSSPFFSCDGCRGGDATGRIPNPKISSQCLLVYTLAGGGWDLKSSFWFCGRGSLTKNTRIHSRYSTCWLSGTVREQLS